MKEIDLGNGMATIVDDEHFDYLKEFAWRPVMGGRNSFYAGKRFYVNNIDGVMWHHSFYLHKVLTGTLFESGIVVDHINGNTLDNRMSNLRITSDSGNALNKTKMLSSNSSGVHGVYWSNTKKRWVAVIQRAGMRYSKRFADLIDAERWRIEKEDELFGEFSAAHHRARKGA